MGLRVFGTQFGVGTIVVTDLRATPMVTKRCCQLFFPVRHYLDCFRIINSTEAHSQGKELHTLAQKGNKKQKPGNHVPYLPTAGPGPWSGGNHKAHSRNAWKGVTGGDEQFNKGLGGVKENINKQIMTHMKQMVSES